MATRLYPLTEKIPKALIEIAGEPFLAHQLRLLKMLGVEHVVLCAGVHGEQIQNYVEDQKCFGLRVDFSFDGAVLLGTAGALRRALPLLGDEFFSIYGDSYLPSDYRAVARSFQASSAPAMMTVYRNDGRWDASNVEMQDGRIVAYDKRERTGGMRHIDYGLGVFRAAAFERVPEGKFFDLAVLYAQLLAEGQLAAYEVGERFYEIGSREGIEELSRFLAEKNA